MTRARVRRAPPREWWTFCSPHSTAFEDVPVVDIERSHTEAEPVPRYMIRGLQEPVNDPASSYEDRILEALAEPKTLEDLAIEVLRRPLSDVIGSRFEFALWALVESGRVKFSPSAPALFVRWLSTLRPNYELAEDRALERIYG